MIFNILYSHKIVRDLKTETKKFKNLSNLFLLSPPNSSQFNLAYLNSPKQVGTLFIPNKSSSQIYDHF